MAPNKFFKSLVSEKLIQDWADTLDWLFDEQRFSKEKGWEKSKVDKFTKKIKKLDGIGESNFIHDSVKNLQFPSKQPDGILLKIGRQKSQARDTVRHIRNGIAHGFAKIKKKHGELYIEIKDYNKSEQSAYIFMPLAYVVKFHKIYREIEESFHKTKYAKRNRGN